MLCRTTYFRSSFLQSFSVAIFWMYRDFGDSLVSLVFMPQNIVHNQSLMLKYYCKIAHGCFSVMMTHKLINSKSLGIRFHIGFQYVNMAVQCTMGYKWYEALKYS